MYSTENDPLFYLSMCLSIHPSISSSIDPSIHNNMYMYINAFHNVMGPPNNIKADAI